MALVVCVLAVIATAVWAATYDPVVTTTATTTTTARRASSTTVRAAGSTTATATSTGSTTTPTSSATTTSPTTTSPTTTGPTTTSPGTTSTRPPATAPDNQVLRGQVTDFLAKFAAAVRTNDTQFLFDHLHPEVVKRFGSDRCRASVQGVHDPTASYLLIDIARIGMYSWVTGKQGADVPNVITATVQTVNQGTGSRVDLHLANVNGIITYFRDCTH